MMVLLQFLQFLEIQTKVFFISLIFHQHVFIIALIPDLHFSALLYQTRNPHSNPSFIHFSSLKIFGLKLEKYNSLRNRQQATHKSMQSDLIFFCFDGFHCNSTEIYSLVIYCATSRTEPSRVNFSISISKFIWSTWTFLVASNN